LRVDVTGTGPTALGNIAADIDKFTAFFTGRALFGWSRHINGIAAFVAFKDSHFFAPFRNPCSYQTRAMPLIRHPFPNSKQYNVVHVKNQPTPSSCPHDRYSQQGGLSHERSKTGND
jgi:hypothetical protein